MDKTITLDYIKQHTEKEDILAGDASTRKYYRIYLTSGETIIKMVIHPDQKKDFYKVINTTEFLTRNNIPVPAIMVTDEENLSIYQEDAGAQHYFDLHEQLISGEQLNWYLQFTDYISAIQNLTKEFDAQKEINLEVLDYKRLMWELEFFIENYYYKMHPGLLNKIEINNLREWLDKIVNQIALYPAVLCHRDYHSKNIMIKDNSAVLIDYQDMRLGPYNYDLASLLWDSYLDISPPIIKKCEERFMQVQGNLKISVDELRLQNRYTAIQRNLKAVGTFASQHNKGNDSYLPFIGQTLRKVLEHLEVVQESSQIKDLISKSPEI
ncbi:MAG: phosphotransferase [Acidobacteria bacterium]|nr:phosphotransferase [Acidobacteriota bacterium]